MPRRQQPEQALHKAVATFLDLALPRTAFWFHPPNGGRRLGVDGAILRRLGVKAGVPDLIIIHDGRIFCIELKAGAHSKLTEPQRRVHHRLMTAGAHVQTCRTVGEVADFLGQFMKLRGKVSKPPSKLLDKHPSDVMVMGH